MMFGSKNEKSKKSTVINCDISNKPDVCNKSMKKMEISESSLKEDAETNSSDHNGTTNITLLKKVLILFCVFFFSAGNQTLSRIFDVLKSNIQDLYGINDTQYSSAAAFKFVSNAIMPFVGGLLIDAFGVNLISIFYVSMTFLGNASLILSLHLKSYFLLNTSRLLHGIGAGTTVIAQQSILSKFFVKTSSLSTVLGIQIMASRLFAFTANIIVKPVNDYFDSIYAGFIVSQAFCFISTLAAICYYYIVKNIPHTSVRKNTSKNMIKKIFVISASFWLISWINMIFGGGLSSFYNLNTDFLQKKYGAQIKAEITSSASLALNIVLSPFVGITIDRIGRRSYLLILSIILAMSGIVSLVYFNPHPVPPLLLVSAAKSIAPVVLTSSIPLVLGSTYVATGLGINKSMKSIGSAIFINISGWILNLYNKNYTKVGILWTVIMSMSFAVSLVYLVFARKYRKGICNANINEKKNIEKEHLIKEPSTYRLLLAKRFFGIGYILLLFASIVLTIVGSVRNLKIKQKRN